LEAKASQASEVVMEEYHPDRWPGLFMKHDIDRRSRATKFKGAPLHE
jgi:hypothetical protein